MIANAIRDIKSCGFHLSSAQFLFGYETDGPESMKVNIGMCKKLGLLSAGFAIPCPYPGTFLYEKAIKEDYLDDEEGWLMELADRDISDRIINMSGMPDSKLKKLIVDAEDEIKMYFIRKNFFIVGYILTILQRFGRIFDIDIFEKLKGIKDGAMNIFKYGKMPGKLMKSGGANDLYIREEVFDILEKWNNRPEMKVKHQTKKVQVVR